MLRKLAIVGILVLILAAAYGAAAALGLNGGSIQAGVDAQLYCDVDGVQVTGWGLETDDSKVYFVTLGDIDAACLGNEMFVRVEDSGGNKLGFGSATIAGSTQQFSFNPAISALSIETLKVWIEGSY
jgi:hypothetical protein